MDAHRLTSDAADQVRLTWRLSAGGYARSEVSLQRGILEFLERARLDAHRGRLGREHLLLLGERVDALAFGLGRDLLHLDLEQAR